MVHYLLNWIVSLPNCFKHNFLEYIMDVICVIDFLDNMSKCIFDNRRCFFLFWCILYQIFQTGMVINYNLNVTICSPPLELQWLMPIQSGVISFWNNVSFKLSFSTFCINRLKVNSCVCTLIKGKVEPAF